MVVDIIAQNLQCQLTIILIVNKKIGVLQGFIYFLKLSTSF